MRTRFVLILIALVGCQTRPYGNVQVGSGYPPGSCQEIGQVIGNAATRDDAERQAMEDLRYNAAMLDGDYVRLIAVTAHGTAARGIAYRCR